MDPISRLFYFIKNLVLSDPPNPNTINKTGIICSDYPIKDNGWIKGWVLNREPKNIIIVEAHAGPSTSAPNNEVFAKDKFGNKIKRTIIAVNGEPVCLNGKTIDPINKGDVAVCLVNKPFPEEITGYDFAEITNKDKYKFCVLFDQKGVANRANMVFRDNFAWITCKDRQNPLIAGDSGTPWFVLQDGKWKVVSHTTRAYWGEGPLYSSPLIFPEIKKRIKNLKPVFYS